MSCTTNAGNTMMATARRIGDPMGRKTMRTVDR
jgi:hypothetical protein